MVIKAVPILAVDSVMYICISFREKQVSHELAYLFLCGCEMII